MELFQRSADLPMAIAIDRARPAHPDHRVDECSVVRFTSIEEVTECIEINHRSINQPADRSLLEALRTTVERREPAALAELAVLGYAAVLLEDEDAIGVALNQAIVCGGSLGGTTDFAPCVAFPVACLARTRGAVSGCADRRARTVGAGANRDRVKAATVRPALLHVPAHAPLLALNACRRPGRRAFVSGAEIRCGAEIAQLERTVLALLETRANAAGVSIRTRRRRNAGVRRRGWCRGGWRRSRNGRWLRFAFLDQARRLDRNANSAFDAGLSATTNLSEALPTKDDRKAPGRMLDERERAARDDAFVRLRRAVLGPRAFHRQHDLHDHFGVAIPGRHEGQSPDLWILESRRRRLTGHRLGNGLTVVAHADLRLRLKRVARQRGA